MCNPLDTFQDQSYKPPIGNTVNYNSSPINNFSKGGDFKPLLNFAVGGKVTTSATSLQVVQFQILL